MNLAISQIEHSVSQFQQVPSVKIFLVSGKHLTGYRAWLQVGERRVWEEEKSYRGTTKHSQPLNVPLELVQRGVRLYAEVDEQYGLTYRLDMDATTLEANQCLSHWTLLE